MSTIAIIGAGPGLGAAVARRFATEGFSIALLARNQERLDAAAAELSAEGFSARGYAADVRRPETLVQALTQAADELGTVEVVQFSPIPAKEFLQPILDTAAHDLQAAFEFSVIGPLTAVQQVLPGMRSLGRGSVLLVNGGSGVRPNAKVAGTSVAFAGEAAYARMLHEVLAPEGITVGQLIVPGAIRPGDPDNAPTVLAERLWQMHSQPTEFRVFSQEMPDAG